jgi:phage baseplate assembly protein gpV
VSIRLASIALAIALVALPAASSSAAAPAPSSASKAPCIAYAKGAHWKYKGQSGTAYTVLGVSGASCATGVKWLQRLTHQHGYGVKGPAGWMCIVESVVGECTLKNGGILEWTPKLKK